MAYDWRKEEYEVTRPGRTRIDYRQEIGRAHVPIGVKRGFAVVDQDRAEVLRAWVSTLIPARGERPAGGDIGAVNLLERRFAEAPPEERFRGFSASSVGGGLLGWPGLHRVSRQDRIGEVAS